MIWGVLGADLDWTGQGRGSGLPTTRHSLHKQAQARVAREHVERLHHRPARAVLCHAEQAPHLMCAGSGGGMLDN